MAVLPWATTTIELERLSDTAVLAASLAPLLRGGDVVLLSGELGAGKTTFTRALVKRLGGSMAVTSPTFTLCHIYDTTPVVAHVDCWRLDREEEIVDLSLDEILDDGGVVVIEWGERAAGLFGADALAVTLSSVVGDETGERRRVEVTARGERWVEALDVLRSRVGAGGLRVGGVAGLGKASPR
jgi:tRNA threonylcarbamoyladenosine biosynthesis protein TsaE